MDFDDDFGDFTSVPADPSHDAPFNSLPFGFPDMSVDVGISSNDVSAIVGTSVESMKVDVGISSNDVSAIVGTSVESQCASSINPMESNSDDDWGDFVEHSSSTVWDNSSTFDWFETAQHSAGQSPSSEAFSVGFANNFPRSSTDWKDGFWIGHSEVKGQHAEQTGNSGFDDLHFSAATGTSNLKGIEAPLPQVQAMDSSQNKITAQQTTPLSERTVSEQKIEIPWRSSLKEINSCPIPLSLFGDTELETGNSETQFVDPATGPFQGHVSDKAVGASLLSLGSKELSNLIANLYTESHPLSNLKSMNNGSFNEPENDKKMGNNFSCYQSSAAGRSYDLENSMLTLNLGLEHASESGSLKGDILITAGPELQSQETISSFRLDSLSKADQFVFVEAWASILAVCASELELALEIWRQAQANGVHLALLADWQGKRYFAAIGQVYVVALILAATSNVYKPWLQVAEKKGENLRADLERCKAVWLETNLKEGVRLAFDELEGSMPTSVVSWKGIELFSTVALEAYLQAARASVDSLCKICLLPMAPFTYAGLHFIEWCGSSYLLPLANLWANCVSQRPPSTCPLT